MYYSSAVTPFRTIREIQDKWIPLRLELVHYKRIKNVDFAMVIFRKIGPWLNYDSMIFYQKWLKLVVP